MAKYFTRSMEVDGKSFLKDFKSICLCFNLLLSNRCGFLNLKGSETGIIIHWRSKGEYSPSTPPKNRKNKKKEKEKVRKLGKLPTRKNLCIELVIGNE